MNRFLGFRFVKTETTTLGSIILPAVDIQGVYIQRCAIGVLIPRPRICVVENVRLYSGRKICYT
jgi:hypothetical protein